MSTNSTVLTPTESGSRTWAILSHVLGLATSWIGPLVIFLVMKGDADGEFAAANAKEALNFQLTLFIVFVGLMISMVGIFLLAIPILSNLVFSIIAAVKASNGLNYRYPLTLRLIK